MEKRYRNTMELAEQAVYLQEVNAYPAMVIHSIEFHTLKQSPFYPNDGLVYTSVKRPHELPTLHGIPILIDDRVEPTVQI